jgi:hypothetical protein
MRRLQFILLTTACILLGATFMSCKDKTIETNQNHNITAKNIAALSSVRNGDFIFRCGKDEVSQLFCRLNKSNQQYSHCGVAISTDSGLYVCHIIGGTDNPDGKIRLEKIQTFIDAVKNKRWAIVRYQLSAKEQSLFLMQLEYFRINNVSFDTQFDLATDDKMYCSELLYKSLIIATKTPGFIEFTQTLSGKKYIAIDNLFQNKHCETICEIAY